MSSDAGRIAVAMSGGVDSSVAAALLARGERPVFGLMLRLWSAGEGRQNRCCSPADMQAARRVAHRLKIPFYVLDVRQEFKRRVVDFFTDGYIRGDTPNPCMRCNRHIRWSTMLDHARALGASHMATGHYARIQTENGTYTLHRGADRSKDQSYVLSVLGQDQLAQTILPLGESSKAEVKELAHQWDLPVASRGESQDLCFLGGEDYRSFLREFKALEPVPGAILDAEGNQLGEHTGLPHYTIGQRKGLGISSSEPLYVIGKDGKRNALVVGSSRERGSSEFEAENVNWVSSRPPAGSLRAMVQIRYRAKERPATLSPERGGSKVSVRFDEPIDDVTPGQAAVFYQGDQCIGGGEIRT